VGAGEIGAQPRRRALGPEDADRLGLALEGREFELLVVEHDRGRLVGGETDRNPHLRSDRLDPRGGVDRVSSEEPFTRCRAHAEADQRLAGVDPDPQAKRCATDRGQLRGVLADPKTGPHCALRIVLVGGRDTEDPDDSVPDELLDRAAEGFDRPACHLEVGAEHPVDVFGVRRLRGRRKSDEVAEDGRDDLALLTTASRWSGGEWGAALHTELRPVGVRVAAVRAREHEGCYPARQGSASPHARWR
jgi:hypothetical protein